MARDYSIEFKLAGEIAGSFFKTMQGAQSALNDVSSTLGNLGKVQADVGKMIDLQNGLGAAGQKMQEARLKADDLARQLELTRAPTKALQDQFKAAQQEVLQLGAEMSRAEKPSEQLKAQYAHAKENLKVLSAEMRTNQKSTRDLEREHNKAAHEADRAEQAFKWQNETLADLSSRTGMADASIADLTARQNRLREATEAATKAQQDLQRINAAKQANLDNRANLRGQMMDAVALGASLYVPVRLAVDFESAMADVKKVVDFDEPGGFELMNKQVLEMSRRLPMAAKDIAAIVAAGGQSGIAANDLGEFAESAIKAGVAFGMTADQAGQMMAEMRTAFGMNQASVNTLMDQINLLANTGAASENVIAAIVQRVGPLGGVAGVAARDIAALGSTLAGMGVKEEVAATGIQNFMLAMVAGESATKKQKAVLKQLGMTSEEVAAGMQEDSKTTMLAVLSGIKEMERDAQAAALVELFGKESVKSIAPLMDQLDLLSENFDKVSDAQRYAGAVQKEYAARAATSENAMQLFRNKVAALGISLGSILLPAINSVMGVIGPMVDAVANFAVAYPGVATALVGVTAALIAGKVAAVGFGYAYTFIKGAVLSVQSAFAVARTAILLHSGALAASTNTSKAAAAAARAMAAAQWVFNVALSANPIGLVVIAIAALIAAGVALYKNWDVISAFLKGVWQGIAPAFEPLIVAVKAIGQAFAPVIDLLGQAWQWFKGLFAPVNASSEALAGATSAGQTFGRILGNVFAVVSLPLQLLLGGIEFVVSGVVKLVTVVIENFDSIKNAFLNFTPLGWMIQGFTALFDYLGGLSLFDSGAKLLETLTAGIKSAVSQPVEAIKGALAKVRDYLPFSDAKVGPLSELTASGQAILNTLGEGMRLAPMPNIVAPLGEIQQAANDAVHSVKIIPFPNAGDVRPAPSAFDGEHGYKNAARKEQQNKNSGGEGGIVIHFSPVINIDGGNADAYAQARAGVAAGAEDLERRLRSIENEKRRLSYE